MSHDVGATAAAAPVPPGFTGTTTTSSTPVEWGINGTPTPSSADAKDDFFLNHHHQIHHSSADSRNVNRSYHGTSTFTILETAGNVGDGTNGTGSGELLKTDDRQGYPNFFQTDDDDDAIIGSHLLESMTNCFQTTTNNDAIKNNNVVNRDHNNNNNGDSKVIPSSSQSNALPTRAPNGDNDTAALPAPVTVVRPDDRNGVLESLLLPTSSSNATNQQNDDSLSYHRMRRHLANRLIGLSTTATGNNSGTTTTGTTNTTAVHVNNSNNHHLMEAALNSSPALTTTMVFENLNREQHQQPLPPSSTLNYDSQAALHSDTSFYHHNISSNESAISAPSKIMQDDENLNGPPENPRLFTTWSSFGAPAVAATTSMEPRSTTPVQLYAGQQSAIGQPRRSLPRTKDIGMNVVEPKNDEDDNNANAPANVIQSHRFHTTTTHTMNSNNNSHDTTTTMATTGTTATTTNHSNHNLTDGTITSDTSHTSGLRSSLQELERGIQNLWSPDAHEFQPQPSLSVVPPATTYHHPNHNMASFASQDHRVPQPTSPASNFYNNNNTNNSSHHPHQNPTNAPFLHSLPSHFVGGGGGPPSGNSSISDPVTTYSSGDMSPLQVEIDLQPYCWDSALSSKYGVSRTLVLMHVSQHYIRISDVRNACETFGVLESFRADFVTKFGIYFISYYDIRSAQYASLELQSILQRISVMSRSNEEVVVQYCLSLNSSSQYDESQIVINNLPTNHHHNHMNETTIMSMLSSYGAVRTMQFLNNDGSSGTSSNSTSSCLVEFQNIQDTKQALLELDNSQPFMGAGGMFASNNVITVHVKPRDENERRLGRDLLALLSRWRHSNNQSNGVGSQQQQLYHRGFAPNASSTTSGVPQHPSSSYNMAIVNGNHIVPSNIGSSPYKLNSSGIAVGDGLGYGNAVGGRTTNTAADPWYRDPMNDPLMAGQQQSVPQHVMGADGRFTPSHLPKAANNAQYDFGATANHNMMDRHQQHYHSQQRLNGGQMYAPHQQSSLNQQSLNNRYSSDRSVSPHQQTSQQHYNDRNRSHHDTRSISNNGMLGSHNTPHYTHTITPTDSNSVLGRSLRSGSGHSHMTPGGHSHGTSIGNASGMDNNLTMDLDLVEIGQDTRTSLMVRNIPNKYTQQMLLSEFDSNGHGPGIIDFFYLPIDFKNRCNRGYAFINFVNFKDILGFHRRYFGKHWRTFNSDKICDITYARIQGKDAMLKRFENSALMEKDDEYKPLVFASDGPNRGTRLPFPDPMNLQQVNHHHHQQQHGNHHLHSQPQSHRHQNNHRHTNPTFNTTSSTSSMDGRTEM